MRLRRTLLVIAEAELMRCNRLRIRISVDSCVYVKSQSSLYQIVIVIWVAVIGLMFNTIHLLDCASGLHLRAAWWHTAGALQVSSIVLRETPSLI